MFQNRRHRPSIPNLPSPRHLSRLAHRIRRRLRNRSETLPLTGRQPSRARHHLHCLRLRAGQHHVAAHGGGGGVDDRPRSRERECEEWGGRHGHDPGLVRVWIAGRCDVGLVGYDPQYPVAGSVDG